MKQFFILFISILTSTTVVKAADVTREIELTQSIYSIEISHDIDVVLTESKESTIRITGEEKATNAVLYDVTKGRLKLLSKKGSLKNRITVFIPVQNLRKLNINGNSHIRSNGNLASEKLQVTMNGQAKVEINNIGDIIFHSDEDIDMQIKKWNTTKLRQ